MKPINTTCHPTLPGEELGYFCQNCIISISSWEKNRQIQTLCIVTRSSNPSWYWPYKQAEKCPDQEVKSMDGLELTEERTWQVKWQGLTLLSGSPPTQDPTVPQALGLKFYKTKLFQDERINFERLRLETNAIIKRKTKQGWVSFSVKGQMVTSYALGTSDDKSAPLLKHKSSGKYNSAMTLALPSRTPNATKKCLSLSKVVFIHIYIHPTDNSYFLK